MKRVHNDHGSASGSPPGSNIPVQQPSASNSASKNRKRKTEGAEPQSSSTRKSSQKSVAPKETKPQQPAAKPLLEQWMDHRKAVEELLRSLNKPQEARTMQQLSEMQKRLSVMTQMSSELNTNPRSQPDLLGATLPGQMGFVSTG